MKNTINFQNENQKLCEENKILHLKIKKNENIIKENNKKIQDNCFHRFKQYTEYQEPTSYLCKDCGLDIYYYDKHKYQNKCIYI